MGNYRRFDIHLSGLIRTLSESLYSRPEVAVRELVQNAVDSCTRRKAEDLACPDRLGVWITFNRSGNQLTVRDVGAGLTRDEISRDLATIGMGATRRLREQLEHQNSPLARELIGQFGIGFLSAFMLAENVELETRSIHETGNGGWRFKAQGDKGYQLEPADYEVCGTTVTLKFKPQCADILNTNDLQRILSHYAGLLKVPIYLGPHDHQINQLPPWSNGGTESAYRRFITERLGRPVLEVIPIHIKEGGVEVRGVLASPESNDFITGADGYVEVYVRHMYVGREQSLLPPWAACVFGMIDTPNLTPTASRESIMQDESYRRIRNLLGKCIIGHFKHLAQTSPERLGKVMAAHHISLKAWAIADRDLLSALGDHLPFRTSLGLLPFRACVEAALFQPPSPDRNRPTLLYRTDTHNETIDRLLMIHGNRLVIDAIGYPDVDLLKAFQQTVTRVDIRNVAELDPVWFGTTDQREGAVRLVNWYRERGCLAQVSTFDPPETPAMYLGRQGNESKYILQPDDAGILILNSNNPAVARLISLSSLNPFAAALGLLKHQAYLASTPHPNPVQVQAANQSLTRILLEMIPTSSAADSEA